MKNKEGLFLTVGLVLFKLGSLPLVLGGAGGGGGGGAGGTEWGWINTDWAFNLERFASLDSLILGLLVLAAGGGTCGGKIFLVSLGGAGGKPKLGTCGTPVSKLRIFKECLFGVKILFSFISKDIYLDKIFGNPISLYRDH